MRQQQVSSTERGNPGRWLGMGPYSIGTFPGEACAECRAQPVARFDGFTFRIDPLYLCAEHAAQFMEDAASDLRAMSPKDATP
jgi:hypothetical protein